MRIVSLCGHLRMSAADRDRDMARKMKIAPSLLAAHTAQHYKQHPECLAKAEADPVWQQRRPIREEAE